LYKNHEIEIKDCDGDKKNNFSLALFDLSDLQMLSDPHSNVLFRVKKNMKNTVVKKEHERHSGQKRT